MKKINAFTVWTLTLAVNVYITIQLYARMDSAILALALGGLITATTTIPAAQYVAQELGPSSN